MNNRIPIAVLAALLIAGSAASADPMPPPGMAEMQRTAADPCQDRVARVTGELAFLEAKLNLTDPQKPLFDRWKKIKLAAAKAAECAPPPGTEPSIVERAKHEAKMLRQRLDELNAELPALETLTASLSADQKNAFVPPHHHGHPDGPGPDPRGPGGEPPPPEH